MADVYSPKTLAAKWGCSAAHVRNLIARGELKGFKLGAKLMRISAENVRDYECGTPLDDYAESSASSIPTKMDAGTGGRLEPLTQIRLETVLRRFTRS